MRCSFLLLLPFLVACANQEIREIKTEVLVPVYCNDSPKADPVVMREVLPYVVEDKKGEVWVGFSSRHYENMSLNIQDVLNHLRQKNAIVEYYEQCIQNANKSEAKEEENN